MPTNEAGSEYTLAMRVGEIDDSCCIEYRSEDEKYTVSQDIPDWLGRILVAGPECLAVCKCLLDWAATCMVKDVDRSFAGQVLLRWARKAVAKAQSQ
ncbi:hypothetical protein LCGC14_1979440 [marine sediment metagenome]|uniref:Uncharacterized protein n=1 Tax=marine sediment metagenome TaxID=412755 RepID=A0A0F9FXK7_9ZZZZ